MLKIELRWNIYFLIGLLFIGCSKDNMAEARKAYDKKDYAVAIDFYTKACDAKDAEACAIVGDMYDEGKGVKCVYRSIRTPGSVDIRTVI